MIFLFLSVITAVIVRTLLPTDKKHYSLLITPPIIMLYAALMVHFMPKKTLPPVAFPRIPQATIEDVQIDIVDSRTDKDQVQIIIYYMNCTDRLNVKREVLKDFDRIYKAVEDIITLREKTKGC